MGCGSRGCGFGCGINRIERDRGDHRKHQRRDNQPDQPARREPLQHQTRRHISGDEGRRSPQPHRAIGSAARSEPAQRIGVGQRQHRRKRHRGDREHQENRHRALHQTDDGHGQHRHDRGQHDCGLKRAAPVGLMCYQRCGDDSHHHRHGNDKADGLRVEPPRLQPKREKRQLNAAEKEICRVEQPEFPGEAIIGGELGCPGHRSVCFALSFGQIGGALAKRFNHVHRAPIKRADAP